MKLEYFDDAFDGNGLLLLHSGSPGEVSRLRATLQKLLVAGASVSLHDLDFVEAVESCEVTAFSAANGRGVRPLAEESLAFEWSLSPANWERAADLLEPFCHALPTGGAGAHFQYLHEFGGTEVIYSTAKEW